MNICMDVDSCISWCGREVLSPSPSCSECDVDTLVPDYTASLPRIHCLKKLQMACTYLWAPSEMVISFTQENAVDLHTEGSAQ